MAAAVLARGLLHIAIDLWRTCDVPGMDLRGTIFLVLGADVCGPDLVEEPQEQRGRDPARHSRGIVRPQRCSGSLGGGVLTQVADETGDVLGDQAADGAAGVDADDHPSAGVEDEPS